MTPSDQPNSLCFFARHKQVKPIYGHHCMNFCDGFNKEVCYV